MSSSAPDARPEAEELPLLERVGLRYVESLTRELGAVDVDDAVHILDPSEWKALVAIERNAIIRSATAGALSALVCVIAVIAADAWFPLPLGEPDWLDYGTYYGLIFGVAVAAAIIEVGYIYRDALRSTLLMARAAGLPLISELDDKADPRVAGALVRAALELPNPAEARDGVDPLREAPRWRLVNQGLGARSASPGMPMRSPVPRCQTRIDSSEPALKAKRPSGEKATAQAMSRWARSERTVDPVSGSERNR